MVKNEFGNQLNLLTANSKSASSISWVSPFVRIKNEGTKPYAERRKQTIKVSVTKKASKSNSHAMMAPSIEMFHNF